MSTSSNKHKQGVKREWKRQDMVENKLCERVVRGSLCVTELGVKELCVCDKSVSDKVNCV